MSKFFELDEADELRAHALDQLVQLSEQSQTNILDMLQTQKVSKLDIKLEKVTLDLPFKAHNSLFVGEEESLRDRSWRVQVEDFHLKSAEGTL